MNDLISRQAVIDALDVGAELLRRVLDEVDVIGAEREKYKWGLGLIESCISDVKELPSVQPEFTDSEIQKIQEIEQAQIKKAYELGFEEGKESVRREMWEYGRDRLD